MAINAITTNPNAAQNINPNYSEVLKRLQELMADAQLLQEYLNQNPPPEGQITALLASMKTLAEKVDADANGDTALTPLIGDLLGNIENAQALLQTGDYAGISTILGNGEFQDQIQNLIYDCAYPSVPPPVQPAKYSDMSQEWRCCANIKQPQR